MPRKRLKYTRELPYHIVVRINNREWFRRELLEVRRIVKEGRIRKKLTRTVFQSPQIIR